MLTNVFICLMWKLSLDLTMIRTWHNSFYHSSAQIFWTQIVFGWAWLEVWCKYCQSLCLFAPCLKISTLSKEQTEKLRELMQIQPFSIDLCHPGKDVVFRHNVWIASARLWQSTRWKEIQNLYTLTGRLWFFSQYLIFDPDQM